MVRLLGMIPALAIIAGCAGGVDNTGPGEDLPPATGDFAIGITTGVAPTFSWSGPSAMGLIVSETATPGSTPRWLLISKDFNGFPSPVTYNQIPANANVGSPTPVPLLSGRVYSVTVTRSDNRMATRYFSP